MLVHLGKELVEFVESGRVVADGAGERRVVSHDTEHGDVLVGDAGVVGGGDRSGAGGRDDDQIAGGEGQ